MIQSNKITRFRCNYVALGTLSALLLTCGGGYADNVMDGMSIPLILGSVEKTLDEYGQELAGSAATDPVACDLVQVLWATNGIFPPQINGEPDSQNSVMETSFIGSQTSFGIVTPSIFSMTLPDGGHISESVGFFVRIFNDSTPSVATYYGDSPLLFNAGATRIIVNIPSTALVIDSTNPELDSDGDGMTDLEEAVAGTNPYDSGSVLSAQISYDSGEQIYWQAVTGKVYHVERNDVSLIEPVWTPMMTVTATTDSVEIFFEATPEANCTYYRIKVAR